MSGFAGPAIAMAAALTAAASFGTAAALQHRQTQLERAGLTPVRLLARLARRPLWLAGITLTTAAFGMQALALAFGPLALVAPIVATDVLFALPLAAVWSGRRMRLADWAGCALTAGGVAMFLASSPSTAGRSDAQALNWLLAFGAVVLACAAALAAAFRQGGTLRGALLGAAAGVVFGLTAAVTLSLTRRLASDGLASAPRHWQLWALIVLGGAGLLLSVTAYQSGQLAASLPTIDTVEPISGVLIGTALFGEHLAASPAVLAVQLAGAAAAAVGIALLSGRATGTPAAGQDQREVPHVSAHSGIGRGTDGSRWPPSCSPASGC